MNDVLKRKMSATKTPKKAAAVTLDSLMRKTMPRDADAVLSLDLLVNSFTIFALENAELREGIGPNDLIYLLEDKTGARGIAVLDPGLTAAITEVQVAGRVSEKPPPERAPTRTDGIVVGEIVDRWLDSAEVAAAEAGLDSAWPLAGFERQPVSISRREAELLLEPVEFRTIDIALDLGGCGRSGRLRLAAPRAVALLEQKMKTTAARVRVHLPELPVHFHVVLTRIPMSVSQVRGLAVGDHVPLPEGCLGRVRLETSDGKTIQRGRLGQLEGRRAVRLSEDGTDEAPGTALSPLPSARTPIAAVPELPDLPGLPEPAGAPEALMPELPDLPELPELPDLT